jgi:hypothetical protein
VDLSRRDLLVAATTLVATQAVAETQTDHATGHVFEAGTRRPVPGIKISNGRDITQTDATGAWSLPVLDGDSIFVIKPSGWMVPLEPGTNLPRFACLHQPHGTPEAFAMRYAGIPPTGPLPPSIDFFLTRAEEPSAFDVLLFTDPQPESDAELTFVRDTAVTLAGSHAAKFGITTGDVMFDDLSMYHRHNHIIGTLGLPWWNLPGNHDMNYESPGNQYSKETFKRLFGARHYAFQYGPATFIMLDNVDYLGDNKYQGRIGPEQLGFVRALLATLPHDALTIICMHVPLHTAVGPEPFSTTIDAADLIALLADRPNCISFAGHTHTNEHHYLGPANHHHHVLTAVSGSWWSGPPDLRGIPVALASDGAPNGFHILSIDGNAALTRLISSENPAAPPLRVMLDGHFARRTPELALALPLSALLGGTIAQDALPAARLLVNFFPGGPRSTLHYVLETDATPRKLTPTLEIDPFVQQIFWRHEASKKPWVHPVKSTHLWQASLPAGLAPGAHRLTITAADEFGNGYETDFQLEVTV